MDAEKHFSIKDVAGGILQATFVPMSILRGLSLEELQGALQLDLFRATVAGTLGTIDLLIWGPTLHAYGLLGYTALSLVDFGATIGRIELRK